jgi:NAD+ diphosphatase
MVESVELYDAYRFCPRCGAGRRDAEPATPFRCQACEYTMFFGPVTAVGGLIFNEEGLVLLIERARNPGKGLLGMPGGFVDPGESAEDCLHREVFEEVGLKIVNVRYLTSGPNRYTFQGVTSPVLDIFYQASIDDTQVINIAPGEVSHSFWSPINSEILDRLAFVSNRRALEFYLQQASRH